jgi:hypothetical protein
MCHRDHVQGYSLAQKHMPPESHGGMIEAQNPCRPF